ncbi:MAG: hypothetical protein K8R46_12825 [Pirellulales bacterium]|nr:hypothetical protein [Pirellulales bacterium]
MVATVVLLAIYVAEDIAYGRIQQGVGPWTTYVLQGVSAAVFGAALVGAGILVRFSRVATFNRLQPGHWLIINFAIVGLLGMLFWPIWRRYSTEPNTSLMICTAIYIMITGVLFCYAAMRLNDAKRWKASFGFFAAVYLLVSITISVLIALPGTLRSSSMLILLLEYGMIALPAAFLIIAIIAIIMFLAAIVIDVRTKCRRDWLHWLGIVMVASIPLINVAWRIARWLALP